ncbi:Protein priA [Vanrija pseudolonga]|uniref:Protein priA n=1 Tax=Vanrija pseudolonga TaxID=143232 RepID=A0AAF0YD99_9TREE|nr:Protein priA [Vanrija pseudolonga]
MRLWYTLLALAAVHTATANFLRCTIIEAANAVIQNQLYTSFSASQLTVGGCESFCAADPKKPGYSYYDPTNFVCLCSTASDVQTSGQVYYPTTDASGTCASWYISAITTRYGASTCITSWSGGPATDLPGSASDPVACMYGCLGTFAGFESAIYSPGKCTCAHNAVPVTDPTCTGGSLLFPRLSSVQPSGGLQYRRAAEQARLAEAKANPHCPRGMDACIVPGTSGYECLDTASELVWATGLLASTLVGPDRSVTCDRGRCVASGCLPGYTLRSDGVCV